jgi:phage FluMu protein Com
MENIKKEKLRCTFCNKLINDTHTHHPTYHLTCLKRREFIIQMKLMTRDELNNRLKELYNR